MKNRNWTNKNISIVPDPCHHSHYLVDDVLELHDGHAHQPVVAAEAVVLDGDVELVRGHLLLVANVAVTKTLLITIITTKLSLRTIEKFR